MDKKVRPDMKADVLLKIADMLENDPDVKAEFNLKVWGVRDPHPGCGFVGCAIGWAVHKGIIPELEEVENPYKPMTGSVMPRLRGTDRGLYEAFISVGDALGLTSVDAERLFNPNSYSAANVSPDEVACRIRTMVAGDD
jgi:hypothetical protein